MGGSGRTLPKCENLFRAPCRSHLLSRAVLLSVALSARVALAAVCLVGMCSIAPCQKAASRDEFARARGVDRTCCFRYFRHFSPPPRSLCCSRLASYLKPPFARLVCGVWICVRARLSGFRAHISLKVGQPLVNDAVIAVVFALPLRMVVSEPHLSGHSGLVKQCRIDRCAVVGGAQILVAAVERVLLVHARVPRVLKTQLLARVPNPVILSWGDSLWIRHANGAKGAHVL